MLTNTTALLSISAAAVILTLSTSVATAQSESDLQLDMGTPIGEGATAEPQMGETYIAEVTGDWEVRCIRTGLEHDPCALHQVLQDGEGNSVARIEMVNLPDGQEAAAGATIVTPLETLLTRQLTLSVDGSAQRTYPFSFCSEGGCVSRVGFTEAEVNAFRRGAVARLTIFPAGAPDTPVNLDASLTGFTDGFARITELNDLNAQAIAEAQAAAQGAEEAPAAE